MPSCIASQAADPGRDGPVPVRLSALALGPLLHVGISGELFVALGRSIRAALGDECTCVAALCDGTVGYIPSEDAFAVGGYEPNASLLEPGEGERIVAAGDRASRRRRPTMPKRPCVGPPTERRRRCP